MATTYSPETSTTTTLPAAESDGLGAGIKHIWNAILRHWLMIALTVAAVMSVAIAAALLIPRKYDATVRLRVEPSQNMLVGQQPTGSSLPDQSIVETEASIMKSHDLAVDVVRQLNMLMDPEFSRHANDLPAKPSAADLDQRANEVADELSDKVTVDREKATYVVDLTVRSKDPEKAAKIANTFAEVYLEKSVNRRTGTAARQATMIQGRLNQLSKGAQAADAQLAQYRAANGIVGEGATSVNDQQITALAGQVATAESDAAATRSKLGVAESQIRSGGLTAVSAVLGSPVISNLRAQRATLVTQYGDISTRYGPKHPDTIRIKEQLDAIDQQIQDEANRVVGSLRSEASADSARAGSLRGDLDRLRGQQSSETRASVAASGYQRAADAAHQAYNQAAELAQRTNQIADAPLSQAQLVEAATVPLEPASPNRKLLVAGGLVLSLLLGAGLVALRELLAAGVRSRRDLERIGLPLLASVPLASRRMTGGRPPADSIVEAPFTAYAEAFRSIRNTLTISSGQPLKVIGLVSSLPSEGKTTTSLSLARVMAMSGERTLIIDADARGAGLLNLLPQKPSIGLVEVLEGQSDWSSVIQHDVVDNLDILPVSSSTFVQSDVFSRQHLEALLAAIGDRYDRIVFDTPPLLGVADARAIASVCDAVLLVVRWDKTPRTAIRSTLELLVQDAAPVVGGILTMVDPRSEAAGGAHYSAYYSTYFQAA